MNPFELIGYAVSLYVGIKLVSMFLSFVRPAVNVKKLGEWALVTGATDGIGRLFENVRKT